MLVIQVLLSQIDNVAGSDNFERTISTFDRNFSTLLIDLLDRIMDFSVSNCEHKLMNILYRSLCFTVKLKYRHFYLTNRTSMTRYCVTRSSATAKSTARPSCLVSVLYDIYRETNNRSTANQPLVRNCSHETYRIPRKSAK